MPFNGNGTYEPPAPQYPAISGQVIYADDWNDIVDDIATALSNCITRDGQSAATANIPMGGFKITGLATGVASTDAVNVLQVFTSPSFANATFTGSTFTVTATLATLPANTVIGSVSPAELSYLDGVTSAIQTQINTKGAHAGQTWTGNHIFTGAVMTVATQSTGDNSTKVASTAYVDLTAFNAGLPLQSPPTADKIPVSDGTNASWQDPSVNLFLPLTYGAFL